MGFVCRLRRGRRRPGVSAARCVIWPLVRRSTVIALIVGSALLAINQGDALLAGRWDAALAWKAPLTYLVPFIVATWGALLSSRVR